MSNYFPPKPPIVVKPKPTEPDIKYVNFTLEELQGLVKELEASELKEISLAVSFEEE
jgi:hypothetical protein